MASRQDEFENTDDEEALDTTLDDVVSHMSRLYTKVKDIHSRLEDAYHVLRDILEEMGKDNGLDWYDLYEDDGGTY